MQTVPAQHRSAPAAGRFSVLAGLWRRTRRARLRRRRKSGRTRLTREGFFYIAVLTFVFIAAMLADMNLLMVLAGMLAGPLWFNYRFVSLTLRGLEVRRRLPRQVCAGDALVATVEIGNTRKRLGSWALVVEERIHRRGGSEPGVRPRVFFSYVPAGQWRSRVYRGRLPRRGHYRFGPIAVVTRFPFGFFRRELLVDESEDLVVYPRLGKLTQQWFRRRLESFESAERRERRHGGAAGEFYGAREWRRGDSRRIIHWRSTARHGNLIVRQFEQQRNRDLAVLLDLWQPAEATTEHRENVELAVSFAATVVADACRKGGSDLTVANSHAPGECLRGPASAAMLREVMESFAVAEASPDDRLPAMLECLLPKIDRGTEVVLVTTRPVNLADPHYVETLGDPARPTALPQIHLVNTADPRLAQIFETE